MQQHFVTATLEVSVLLSSAARDSVTADFGILFSICSPKISVERLPRKQKTGLHGLWEDTVAGH